MDGAPGRAASGALPRFVLVVGMHRSGTSALTGLLAALGLGLPRSDDLMCGGPDNPVHFESNALTELDDRLLDALGGSWDAPPDLSGDWAESEAVGQLVAEAATAAQAVYGAVGGPVVWKDPRSCLLLPFWRRILPAPQAAVFIWRSPLAVARSLNARDRLSLSHGVALWERYNRMALDNLVGGEVFSLSYDRLVEDSLAVANALSDWLSRVGGGGFLPRAPGPAAESVRGALRHHGKGDSGLLIDSQVRLLAALKALEGPSAPFAVPPSGEESLWVADLIAAARERRTYAGEVRRLASELAARRADEMVGGADLPGGREDDATALRPLLRLAKSLREKNR